MNSAMPNPEIRKPAGDRKPDLGPSPRGCFGSAGGKPGLRIAGWRGMVLAGWLGCAAASGLGADTNGFVRQMITLPEKDAPTRFASLSQDGRADLLVVDPAKQTLLIYRQRAWGFTNVPDQVLTMPAQTTWVAPYPVESPTNMELLLSTASGLFYCRQTGGVFEAEPRPLVRAGQVFTDDRHPDLVSLATNAMIPVMTATQAWFYTRNEASAWTSGPPAALTELHGSWSGYANGWSLGQGSAFTMNISQTWRSTPDQAGDDKPENDAIGALMADMKKAGRWHQPHVSRADLNGDGRADFIPWRVLGDWDRTTDIYVYLRGADGKLPERPSQVLHCLGFPIPVGTSQRPEPVADLKGDGKYDLVLLEPHLQFTSISSVVDTLLSRGVDMALTIRPFTHGAFPRTAEVGVTCKALHSIYGSYQWPFFIYGDFNHDGRPDFVIQRTNDRWEIYCSTNDGHWFQPQPALTVELPGEGYFERHYFEIADLNGDGRADMVSHDLDDPRLFIFLTQPALPTRNGTP